MKKLIVMIFCMVLSLSLASAISVDEFSLADLGFTGFVVEANLDAQGSAQVLYGKTGALGSASSLASSSREHLLQVDGLQENTVYFYRVVGTDAQGNSYSSAISLTRTASNSASSSNNQPVDTSELKAFPSAEGFGKYATGGRGGRVIKVTNLNNDGPGSLRAAIDQTGPRIIVFEVGGDIKLQKSIRISAGESDVTIAGETAPYPGITLVGENLDIGVYGALFDIHDSNVIIRYITIRAEDRDNRDIDALRIRTYTSKPFEKFIFDHLSMSHANDEVFSLGGTSSSIREVTLQNSMIGEPNNEYNFLLGRNTYDISIIKNYFHNSGDRSVLFGYGLAKETSEMINNVVYGYQGATNIAFGSIVDVIGNIYKPYPYLMPRQSIGYGANRYNNPEAVESDGAFFRKDNIFLDGVPNGDANARRYGKSNRVIKNSLVNSWLIKQSEIEKTVLTKVGNSLHRDSMDNQHIADYYEGTGDFEIQPILEKKSSSRPSNYDTDNDGIADSWEFNVGGVVGRADNNGDHDGDGYTNVEEYLHFLAGEGHS